jgi:hypothetical protein
MKVSYMGDGKNQMIDEWIEKQNLHGSIKAQMGKVTHLPKGVHMGVNQKQEYIA